MGNHLPRIIIYVFTANRTREIRDIDTEKNLGLKPHTTLQHSKTGIGVSLTIQKSQWEFINIYSPSRNNTELTLADQRPLGNCILAGNFNSHHRDWYGPLATERSKIIGASTASARFINNWTRKHVLRLLNTPGTLTHFPKNQSRPTIPDQYFASEDIYAGFSAWNSDPDGGGDSDHALITTTLSINILKFVSHRLDNLTNWPVFERIISNMSLRKKDVNTPQGSLEAARLLTNTIKLATE